MQKKKRMVRTLFVVTFLSVIVLFSCAGKSVSADPLKCNPGDPCVGWGGTEFKNPDAFKNFLMENEISIVTFVDQNGRVFISEHNFKDKADFELGEIKPCIDNCPKLEGKKIISFSQTATHVVEASWPCILMEMGAFRFWWDVVNNRPCTPTP